MRVASWNILGARGWRPGEHPARQPGPPRPWIPGAITAAIAELAPDLIALQECPPRPQVEAMAAALGWQLAWFPARWGGDASWPGGFPGAILSRWPLASSSDEIARCRPDPDCFQRHWGRVELQGPLGALMIHAYHCCADFDGRSHEAVRCREIAALVAAVGDRSPCILLGDHNSRPGEAPLQPLLRHGFVDAHQAAGHGSGDTDPADAPIQRIDQCWVRGLRVTACHVPDDPVFSGAEGGVALSDHRPVVVELAASW